MYFSSESVSLKQFEKFDEIGGGYVLLVFVVVVGVVKVEKKKLKNLHLTDSKNLIT
jgi:ribonuclease HII